MIPVVVTRISGSRTLQKTKGQTNLATLPSQSPNPMLDPIFTTPINKKLLVLSNNHASFPSLHSSSFAQKALAPHSASHAIGHFGIIRSHLAFPMHLTIQNIHVSCTR